MSYSKEQLEQMGFVEGRDFTEMPTAEVQNFESAPYQVPRFHQRADGAIVDRRLVEWRPYPKFKPPRNTPLLVALDDPQFPAAYSLEFAEFTGSGGWTLVGADAPDHPVRYWARVDTPPRIRQTP